MSDHTPGLGKSPADRALERIDSVVDDLNRRRRIDAAVEEDDHPASGFADADVVNVAQAPLSGRRLGKRSLDSAREIGLGQLSLRLGFSRLDVGLDLDALADFVSDGVLELGGKRMGVAERHRPIDFEIEGDRLAPFDLLDGDVVHRQAAPGCNHQHPLEDRFVVELERVGGNGEIGLWPSPGDARLQLGLDRGDALERQGA